MLAYTAVKLVAATRNISFQHADFYMKDLTISEEDALMGEAPLLESQSKTRWINMVSEFWSQMQQVFSVDKPKGTQEERASCSARLLAELHTLKTTLEATKDPEAEDSDTEAHKKVTGKRCCPG